MRKKRNYQSIVRVLVLTVVLILQVTVFPEDTNAGVDCWTMYVTTNRDVPVIFICYLGGDDYEECQFECDEDIFDIECQRLLFGPDECNWLFNTTVYHNCEEVGAACAGLICLDFFKNYVIREECGDHCDLCVINLA